MRCPQVEAHVHKPRPLVLARTDRAVGDGVVAHDETGTDNWNRSGQAAQRAAAVVSDHVGQGRRDVDT